MDARESLKAHAVRQSLGNPSDEEQSYFLENVFRQAGEEQIDRHQNEQFVAKLLGVFKEAHEKGGHSTTRVALCASMILNGCGSGLKKYAQGALNAGEIEAHRLFFDAYYGMRTTMAILILAENEMEGKTDEQITNEVAFLGEVERSPTSDQADRYLAMINEAKKDADLLRQDPSGFLLIDNYFEYLEGVKELPGQSKGYVLAGAKLAMELYKSVYQISAKLASD